MMKARSSRFSTLLSKSKCWRDIRGLRKYPFTALAVIKSKGGIIGSIARNRGKRRTMVECPVAICVDSRREPSIQPK